MIIEGIFFFFFFNDTATTEIYTLSLHDALPISPGPGRARHVVLVRALALLDARPSPRSEEHTSELQSPDHLVCRLLLDKTGIARKRSLPERGPRAQGRRNRGARARSLRTSPRPSGWRSGVPGHCRASRARIDIPPRGRKVPGPLDSRGTRHPRESASQSGGYPRACPA